MFIIEGPAAALTPFHVFPRLEEVFLTDENVIKEQNLSKCAIIIMVDSNDRNMIGFDSVSRDQHRIQCPASRDAR